MVRLLLILAFLSCSFPSFASVTSQPGELRWGGDTEGGAPYMYQDPDDMNSLVGYEVEIIEAIASHMGMKPIFVQNGWDNLIPGLERRLYDVSIDGLEITPEHQDVVDFSMPYYVTHLQIAVRRDNFDIVELDDCKGRVMGTLKQSYSQYVLETLGDVEIRTYEDEINAYTDLVNGRLDGTLFDAPIALYYGGPMREVKFVGPPIGKIEYGIAVPKDNPELLDLINSAVTSLRDSGKLRSILERWNLWNPMVAEEFHDLGPVKTQPVMYDKWIESHRPSFSLMDRVKRYSSFMPKLGTAALTTMKVSVASMVLAVIFGLMLALVRVFGPAPLSTLSMWYVEIVRGTPVLIQLFFIFYGLPNIGVKLSPFMAGVIGLGMNYAAYEAEIYRAGLMSVPVGQMEAALGLGMTRREALRHVVVPQAVRMVLPPVTNDFISLLKDSSLVSVITLVDLTKAYGQIATTYYDYFGTGIIVAAIYFLLGYPFIRLARWTERKMEASFVPDRVRKNRRTGLGLRLF
ncbi:MAG: transporter substrate-binding domain-containing protein [Synergistales bacterium]|nr:transporter substrate-binding domain-containing protein [Synergistales bacterium]